MASFDNGAPLPSGIATTLIGQDASGKGVVHANREPIAVGLIGQSVELGSVTAADRAAYPQAFAALNNRAFTAPGGPASGDNGSGRGGFWCAVYDALYDHGYDMRFVNGALGSMSFVKDAAGQVLFRNNNMAVRAQRTPVFGAAGDRGYYGDVLVQGGKVFVATTGRSVAAFSDGPFKVLGGQTNLDYIETVGTHTTAASDPGGWSAATLGSTITDGTVVWTCISENSASLGLTNGKVFSQTQKGFGFDPFGALARVHAEMQQIRGVTRKIIYIQNGQSDQNASGTVAGWYRDALVGMANYFLDRGYEVMVGLTTYYPRATTAGYDVIEQGRADALTALQASAYGSRVFAGANLYRAMGTTGPMGGSRFTASITSNVMTVTATSGGTGIVAGQTLTDSNGVVIGTITSLGTYAAGTGTVNVTAADRASQTLQTVGDFIYPSDATHLNGRGNVGPALNGVEPIAKHVADAFKAILPQRPTY